MWSKKKAISSCGDSTQRNEDDERDPHPNRNAVGKRVTTGDTATSRVSHSSSFMVSSHLGRSPRGQPFTYELFDALRPSEFERRGSWFAESYEPPNCCWAHGITPKFRRDSIRRWANRERFAYGLCSHPLVVSISVLGRLVLALRASLAKSSSQSARR